MYEDAFQYPKLYYFQSGNFYTGSYKGLNYKVEIATKENGEEGGEKVLKVSVWYGQLCSTMSEIVAESVFPVTEEGLEQSRAYLREQHTLFLKKV